MIYAYDTKNYAEFEKISNLMLGILEDMDTILGTNEHFLFGKWLEDAEKLGET